MEHRIGGTNYGTVGAPDSRIPKIIRQQLSMNPGLSPLQPTGDSFSFFSRFGAKNAPPIFSFGKVNQAAPFMGWYKVELENSYGSLGCFRGKTNNSPLGRIDFEMILPGQRVLVMHHPGATVGTILCVAPSSLYDAWVYRPGWLLQGAGTGFFRNAAHNQGAKLDRNGGMLDFSGGSPIDSLLLDTGGTFITGSTFLHNPYLIQLRMSEICGLTLNWVDEATRLAGKLLEVFSPAELLFQGTDSGVEPFSERLSLIYDWEGVGYLQNGVDATETTTDNKVWYSALQGSVDRKAADKAIRPYGRVVEYGGYLGQGGYEAISAPAASSTVNGPDHNPVGLLTISKGLEGSLAIQAAQSISLVKQLVNAYPQRRKDPADPTGDRSKGQTPNYKGSGLTGGGPAHVVKAALDATGTAVDDELAYLTGWKAIHPFYYHKLDFELQNDRDSIFTRSQENVDYSPISARRAMTPATPVQCRIDHRYGNVDYYRRTSFLMLRPDGSIDLGDGSGCHFGARNGKIFMHAPDGIEILSGGRTLILTGELVTVSHGSTDMSSSNGDVRVAAQKGNLQTLSKSAIIEATDEEGGFLYHDKVGEDVISSGVILKSKTSIVTWSDNVYMRTGVGTQKSGDIVLDANKRKSSIILHAQQTNYFTESGINMWVGNIDQGKFTTLHSFGRDASIIGNQCVIRGNVGIIGADVGASAQLFVSGPIYSGASISCAGQMADKSGAVSKVPDDFGKRLNDARDKNEQTLKDALSVAEPFYDTYFTNNLYDDNRPGNTDLISDAGFSFRDDDDSRQYGSAALILDEPRWQRWLRLGLASGGGTWRQESITYQGKNLFPYPGRKAWAENQILQQTDASDVIDFQNGRVADRTDATGNATPGTQRMVTMLGNFKVMIG